MKGKIAAVCTSTKKGTQKCDVGSVTITTDYGIEGDAHAGPWHRQVSMLAAESIEAMRQKGLTLAPGDFGENIVTEGINLLELKVGSRLRLGASVVGEVTQIGKTCHQRCAIFYQAGDCIMPREGIFLRVLSGGKVTVGDDIEVLEDAPTEGS
ncbi:MAG TPA: MOSC domain-containing protein [Thermodesulfobacteriota bacterium]|nr:MOSC domain-containing protein [Thermodesulfobacteriota bacterium]HNU70930.1 MOSC domain-containing protein [Thermodesulfobacteriota bacterium]HQO79215.1 MOSC domain-containing protein [Thermodesulfobacteriota bacterium]